MSEDRSVIYKIRWEILVMAASLILSAVVVVAIPHNFSEKLIEEQKALKEKQEMQKEIEMEERIGFEDETGSNSAISRP
ncbi:MAG: hypothetical protein QXU32_00465 [Nitrososphaerales archaeon]